MFGADSTPAEKRRLFREGLAGEDLLVFPGAFNPLSARLIQAKGFAGVYLSGAVMSAELGLPDIGLTTLSEISTRAAQVSAATDLPVLVDADTGFGEPLNVARTVTLLEHAGVAGIHFEDQVNPKRCGHLDGKQVVDTELAIRRIRAAVDARRDPNLVIMARTDVREEYGLAATIDRARALIAAGADALFPEALHSPEEFAEVASAVSVPILANMTEFGKSPLFTHDVLRDSGVRMVIHPVSLLRLAMGAAERGLDALAATGTLEDIKPEMQTRSDLYDLLDYASYGRFDASIYSFQGTLAGPATTPATEE